jgi:hypothetical protein
MSFTVEPKSNDSSLSSSAVIMPEIAPASASTMTSSSEMETPREQRWTASVEDDDGESVISMSTESSFIDVEGATTITGTAASEDQRERDEFDFVDESDKETADEL